MYVRIYQPARTATQSGRAKTHQWLVEPQLTTPRTPEPLMGWIRADDSLSALRNKLKFPTVDDAIAFAHHQGWEYYVEETATRCLVPRNYLDNFRIILSAPC